MGLLTRLVWLCIYLSLNSDIVAAFVIKDIEVSRFLACIARGDYWNNAGLSIGSVCQLEGACSFR